MCITPSTLEWEPIWTALPTGSRGFCIRFAVGVGCSGRYIISFTTQRNDIPDLTLAASTRLLCRRTNRMREFRGVPRTLSFRASAAEEAYHLSIVFRISDCEDSSSSSASAGPGDLLIGAVCDWLPTVSIVRSNALNTDGDVSLAAIAPAIPGFPARYSISAEDERAHARALFLLKELELFRLALHELRVAATCNPLRQNGSHCGSQQYSALQGNLSARFADLDAIAVRVHRERRGGVYDVPRELLSELLSESFRRSVCILCSTEPRPFSPQQLSISAALAFECLQLSIKWCAKLSTIVNRRGSTLLNTT